MNINLNPSNPGNPNPPSPGESQGKQSFTGPSGSTSDITSPGLGDFGKGQGSGAGGIEHTCPTGQHWDDAKQSCVNDIQVGNKPDGHDYLIQTSNVEGLVWNTVYEDNNLTDANKDYSTAIASGGYWQLLVDGVMTRTNLPLDQRYEAVEKKKQEDYLKTIFSVEAFFSPNWSWIADFDNLADAKQAVKNIRNMTGDINASIPPSSTLRITDKHGDTVFTDLGEVLQTVFWSVEQSPTTDMTRWVLRWGPGASYGDAKAQFGSIIAVEPVDILRIVDSKGNVYDKYSPKAGAESGPMAGMGGLLIGLALVIVIAGIGGVAHGSI